MTIKTKKVISRSFTGVISVILVFGIGLHMNIIKLPYIVKMNTQYVADFRDNRVLVGSFDNVFAGRVIKQIGTKARRTTPETQFEVEVILNIKGDLPESVVVTQFGGYRNGILYIMSGETGDSLHPGDNIKYLLQPGSTYLFATRGPSSTPYYTLGTHKASLTLISTDKTLSRLQLNELAKKEDRVKALQLAYPNEILLEADIANNRTRNSFTSLSVEEQEKIKAEVAQIKAQNGTAATE